jgi:AhpD family alkylhydroperoxidase
MKKGSFLNIEDLRLMNRYGKHAGMLYDTFNDYYSVVHQEEGVLSDKVKELIALGASVATHCMPCIHLHTEKALKAGATKEEVAETIFVASMLGAASALTHGVVAVKAMEETE